GYTRGGSSTLRYRPPPKRQDQRADQQNMPVAPRESALIIVILVSGLFAIGRGFMREILSIIAWILAAVATLYAYSKLLPLAKQYFNNDIVAAVVVIGGGFFMTLLVVSILAVWNFVK